MHRRENKYWQTESFKNRFFLLTITINAVNESRKAKKSLLAMNVKVLKIKQLKVLDLQTKPRADNCKSIY